VYLCTYLGMNVKIPILSACPSADPNACVVVTAEMATAVSEGAAACKAKQYVNCTWADNMPWTMLWYMGGSSSNGNSVGLKLMFTMCRENQVITGDKYFELTEGMQLKLPYWKLVAYGNRSGDGGGPSLHGEECVDKPGPGGHWCYRIQLYTYIDGIWGGDYLYNISQNVPSLPMPDWRPLCTPGIQNCSYVQPLAAVEIPIAGQAPTPSPSGNECHPSKICNVCEACCQEYIPNGAACDNCVETQCPSAHNECHPSLTCNVCAACCQSYIPDGAQCDACVASQCPKERGNQLA
jgi:hypothetical protein